MSRRLVVLDRLAGLLLGLALVALGLLAIDWDAGRVVDLPQRIDTSSVDDVLGSAWWPWAAGAGGLLLGVLGLWWLLAHLRRHRESTTHLAAGDETGALVVDLASVASAAADRLAALGPLTSVHGSARRVRGSTRVELRGHVAPHAESDAVLAAVATVCDEVTGSFDDGTVSCRVLLDGPRARRAARVDRVRVAAPAADRPAAVE